MRNLGLCLVALLGKMNIFFASLERHRELWIIEFTRDSREGQRLLHHSMVSLRRCLSEASKRAISLPRVTWIWKILQSALAKVQCFQTSPESDVHLDDGSCSHEKPVMISCETVISVPCVERLHSGRHVMGAGRCERDFPQESIQVPYHGDLLIDTDELLNEIGGERRGPDLPVDRSRLGIEGLSVILGVRKRTVPRFLAPRLQLFGPSESSSGISSVHRECVLRLVFFERRF